MKHIERRLAIRAQETFFLWGPRQTGKTTYLEHRFPDAYRIDLLESDVFVKYLSAPHLLRQELRESRLKNRSGPPLVIIDEVQKVPALLDEVQLLIGRDQFVFGLCGSSARKVRRGYANLLGGRAVRYELHGLVSAELKKDFDLTRACRNGVLPPAYFAEDAARFFRSYIGDYLKDEIAAEGLVRKLPAFSDFLRAAAISDTELINFTNIASDCGVSKSGAEGYFQILEDTLFGRFLPAYTERPKRRTIEAPKFYFSDVGVVNHLAQRHEISPGSELFGKAFENLLHHELRAYAAYSEKYFDLSFWRLSSGVEVDFILNDMAIAVEAKAVQRVTDRHLKGLREVYSDYPSLKQRILVALEKKSRRTDDGIRILSVTDFLEELWAGQIV